MNTYKVTVSGTFNAASQGDVERFLIDTVQPEARRGGFADTKLVSIEQVVTAPVDLTPRSDAERRAVEAALRAVRNG